MTTPRSKPKEQFYASRAWKQLRRAYALSKHYICEECGQKGEEVHHKIAIDEDRLKDAEYLKDVALNPENLELLCTSCHNAKRNAGIIDEKLEFDENGDIIERHGIINH